MFGDDRIVGRNFLEFGAGTHAPGNNRIGKYQPAIPPLETGGREASRNRE